MSRHRPRRAKKRDYFFAAFAGAAFLAGAAFFTAAVDFAAAALAGALAGAFFAAGFAAALAAGFLAGAAFFAGAALALAGAAFFTAGFAAAFAAGFLAGAAFALGAAAFGLAAGAAFFTAVAAFAATAFTGAFFAGALDAGALDDVLAMRCPLRLCRWPLVTRRAYAYLTRACLASEALRRLNFGYIESMSAMIDSESGKDSSRVTANFCRRISERCDSCDLLVKLTISCGGVDRAWSLVACRVAKTVAFPRLILLDQGDNKNSTKLYVSFLLAFILSEMWTPEPANDSDP